VPLPPQTDLFDSPLKQLAKELAVVDPNNMTPIQALEKLEKLVSTYRKTIDKQL
jgi:hypothetical protein